MKIIPFVTPEQHDLALYIERVLLSLPEASGILFVACRVQSSNLSNDIWVTNIAVGCSRNLEISAVKALVLETLRKDQRVSDARGNLLVEVFRGVARSPTKAS